ncbi:MAG: segregation ATPase, FtsK/SpoIIIE family protein, partial [Candidatus Roizmanbacteria bacterium GW2011_GWA2_32_13]
KALVGVEIPNKIAVNVRLRDVIESIQKDSPKSSLVLPLGRDISGKVFYDYLDKMPHLLVAGSTGSGKSVAMNSFIGSLTYFNSPKMLRFILIDPKRVEFSIYEGIPHLLTQVVVNVKKAISALKWLTNEMDNRYEILEQAKVRDIKSYNKEISKKQENMPMPYLIVMIDEMADLMVQYKREVEFI